MRHLLRFITIFAFAFSMFACSEKGKPGPCEVKAHIAMPEYTIAQFKSSDGKILIDTLQIEGESLTFARTDVESMPYIGMLVLLNPADSMDIIEVPVAIENGQIDITVDNGVMVKGSPTNKRIQKFLRERGQLHKSLLEKAEAESNYDPSMIREAYSQFYGEQIVKNIDNPLALYIYNAYNGNLDEETLNKVKVLMEKQ